MTDTIYKYELDFQDTNLIKMPLYAKPLQVVLQRGVPVLYAIVNKNAPLPSEPMAIHTIYCRGTGHPLNGHEDKYLGTVLIADDNLVFHFFTHKDVD